MKKKIKSILNFLKSPKRKTKKLLKIGTIISIQDQEYSDFDIAKAVTPIGCNECGEILYTTKGHHHYR